MLLWDQHFTCSVILNSLLWVFFAGQPNKKDAGSKTIFTSFNWASSLILTNLFFFNFPIILTNLFFHFFCFFLGYFLLFISLYFSYQFNKLKLLKKYFLFLLNEVKTWSKNVVKVSTRFGVFCPDSLYYLGYFKSPLD